MKSFRLAVIGAGFWSHFQVAAWREVEDVQIVAVCDQDKEKAEHLANKYSIPAVYHDVDTLLSTEAIDVVDVITNVETHASITLAAAEKKIAVICQKPMATTLASSEGMVNTCLRKKVPLFIHENFRWQAPIRALKQKVDTGVIGSLFKARVSFCSAFPVFNNQPSLAELDRFIIMDIGSHVLDICRFLFGEVRFLNCLTTRINKKIKGEDVANVLMQMQNGLHCFAEMSYASILEKESFPQTLVFIEGESGSISLTHDFELKITTRNGTTAQRVDIPYYEWADPAYAVVHSSIVDCNKNILDGLKGGHCETTGTDNLKTMQLVWACYESAASGKSITF